MTTDLLSTLPVPEPRKNNIMEMATGVSPSGRSRVSNGRSCCRCKGKGDKGS